MMWSEGTLKVLGTIILPVVAMPCIMGTYLIYMVCSPDPKDGTLFLALVGALSGLGGFAGYQVGKLRLRGQMKELQEKCDKQEVV